MVHTYLAPSVEENAYREEEPAHFEEDASNVDYVLAVYRVKSSVVLGTPKHVGPTLELPLKPDHLFKFDRINCLYLVP